MIHTHNEFNGGPALSVPGAEAFTAKDFTALLPEIERTFAGHDAQIRELQQALVHKANAPEAEPLVDQVSALGERVAQLESRLVEQDRMIRHTLTMLIEWIETQGAHPPAD